MCGLELAAMPTASDSLVMMAALRVSFVTSRVPPASCESRRACDGMNIEAACCCFRRPLIATQRTAPIQDTMEAFEARARKIQFLRWPHGKTAPIWRSMSPRALLLHCADDTEDAF